MDITYTRRSRSVILYGRNPAPVDKLIGGFSHYLQGFKNIPGGWPWDFWTINSTCTVFFPSVSSTSWNFFGKRNHQQREVTKKPTNNRDQKRDLLNKKTSNNHQHEKPTWSNDHPKKMTWRKPKKPSIAQPVSTRLSRGQNPSCQGGEEFTLKTLGDILLRWWFAWHPRVSMEVSN